MGKLMKRKRRREEKSGREIMFKKQWPSQAKKQKSKYQRAGANITKVLVLPQKLATVRLN